jgi:HEAT repeat protein
MTDNIASCIQNLSAADVNLRINAARELAMAENSACSAAVALTKACADENEEVSEWATAALEELGEPPAEFARSLGELLTDPCLDVAYWAATLLGRLKHRASVAVDQIENALTEHVESAVRQRAAWALGQMGTVAESVLPLLQSASQSDDVRLARLAREAIAEIQKG